MSIKKTGENPRGSTFIYLRVSTGGFSQIDKAGKGKAG